MYKAKFINRFLLTGFFIVVIFLTLISKVSAELSFTELGSFVDEGDPVDNSFFGLYGNQYGDVNGDGFADLIIGANRYGSSAGRMYIYFGGKLLNFNADVVINAEAASDLFSASAISSSFDMNDLNNDGYEDFLAGAMGNDDNGDSSGKGYVYLGSDDIQGIMAADYTSLTFAGNANYKRGLGGNFTAGDYNGDGILDVAYNAFAANSNAGAVIIFYGNGDDTFTEGLQPLTVSGSTALGYYSLNSGNVNGDEYDDIIVSESYNQGEIYIFQGDLSVEDKTYDTKIIAETTSDYLGRSQYVMEDINNDGYDDVCVGAFRNSSDFTYGGRVYCWFGSSGFSGMKQAASADIIFSGQEENDNFGRSLAAYDINNDNHLDLIVGAYQGSGSSNGKVYVFLGDGTTNFDTNSDAEISIAQTGNLFGNWVEGGDFDADGYPEIFSTSARGGNGTGITGRTYLFEVAHGSPSITKASEKITDESITITGTVEDGEQTVAGVQWSMGSEASGEWYECEAVDGAFDSGSEEYTCNIPREFLTDEGMRVYFRSYDGNGVYMPAGEYTSEFVIEELPETGRELLRVFVLVTFIPLISLFIRKHLKTKLRLSDAAMT